jgi:peroxiredoxin Q/BCP
MASKQQRIGVGDVAPDFELSDQSGNAVRLSELAARSPAIVLYFYPKDDTPGCTIEACEFRDHLSEFTLAGAQVVGVSSDDAASHRRFADKYKLPFVLLADVAGRARELFGVSKLFGLLPARVTFVIDRERVVRHVFSSQLRARAHIEEALRIVRELAAADATQRVPGSPAPHAT